MSKHFVTLTLVCAFGAIAFDKGEAMVEFLARSNQCREEVGANDSDFAEMINRKPASTMEGKCLRSCFMKKSGEMDSNGKYDKDAAIAEAKKVTGGDEYKLKFAIEVIDACSVIEVSDDHCEAAEEYGKCIHDYILDRITKHKFIH